MSLSSDGHYRRSAVGILVLAALLAAGCSDSDAPRQREYGVTLTEVDAVKKGSNEALAVNDLPAPGATVTVTAEAPP